MLRIKPTALILLTLAATGLLSTSSALAAGKGELVNKSGGALVKNKLTATSSSVNKLETPAGSKLECTSASISGSVESKTTGSGTATFTGCQTGGAKCKAGSETTGTIALPLNWRLVAIGGKDTWEKILNGTGTEKVVTITCPSLGVTIEVKGALPLPVSTEGSLKTEFTFSAKGSKGVQEQEVKEKALEVKFSNSASKAFEKASLSLPELKVKFEEEAEFI